MENMIDSFKHMQVKKVLFAESVDPDEEVLNIGSWKTGLATRRSLSCGDICDEDFYPSEVGKEMILEDQYREAQAGITLKNVTSSSSWAINSPHYPFESFSRSVNQQCRELFVNSNNLTVCSGFKASTPKSNQPYLFPTTATLSKTKDAILKSSVEDHHEMEFPRRDSSLFPMLLHCMTTANEFCAPTILGNAKKENIWTLKDREISKESSSSKGKSSFQSFNFHGCDDTTLRTSVKNDVRSLNVEGDLWIVQPQALELDTNGKGRLLLINKSSSRNLKFKIIFNGKLINVCPQSGNLKSKSQLGLRVTVFRGVNENPKEVIEDVIRIICGNKEKRVPVKLRKVQKINSTKDRSYRYF